MANLPDPSRYALIAGPYRPPPDLRRGDWLDCEIRGAVRVGGYTDAPIPWPRLLKTGRPALILCGDLVRAVRVESELAVAHWWGVSVTTVWAWRKALGVGRITEGTGRLYGEYAPHKLPEDVSERGREAAATPEARARIAASKAGKPVPAATRAALLRAAKARKRRAHREAIGRSNHRYWLDLWAPHRPAEWAVLADAAMAHRRLAPAPSRGRRWHPTEDALLGLAPDSIVGQIVQRSRESVHLRRQRLGIPAWSPPR